LALMRSRRALRGWAVRSLPAQLPGVPRPRPTRSPVHDYHQARNRTQTGRPTWIRPARTFPVEGAPADRRATSCGNGRTLEGADALPRALATDFTAAQAAALRAVHGLRRLLWTWAGTRRYGLGGVAGLCPLQLRATADAISRFSNNHRRPDRHFLGLRSAPRTAARRLGVRYLRRRQRARVLKKLHVVLRTTERNRPCAGRAPKALPIAGGVKNRARCSTESCAASFVRRPDYRRSVIRTTTRGHRGGGPPRGLGKNPSTRDGRVTDRRGHAANPRACRTGLPRRRPWGRGRPRRRSDSFSRPRDKVEGGRAITSPSRR